jgi:endonuclease/exonuclease/phosphatase (EEP) superfamily protein YafD
MTALARPAGRRNGERQQGVIDQNMKSVSVVFGTIAALVLAAIAARYVTGFWLFATFASLQLHGAVVAFGLGLASFLLRRHWINLGLIVAAALVGLHGYVMLGEFRQPALDNYGNAPTVKLLSINIEGNNDANRTRIADYIIGSGADVVFIQESAPIGPEIPRIRAVYPYRLGCGAQTITCDSSLWSKRPLTTGQVITASPIYRDRLMIAGIDFGGHVINFVNVHLTKPYFDNFHQVELAKIREAINPIKGPMVLAGDFNTSILTPDVRGFLKQTRLMTFEHEPNTIPVRAPAVGLAIDHVFVRDPLRIKTLTRVPDPLGSNHFGLVADLILIDPTASYPPR